MVMSKLDVMNHELLVSAGIGRSVAARGLPRSAQLANPRAILPHRISSVKSGATAAGIDAPYLITVLEVLERAESMQFCLPVFS